MHRTGAGWAITVGTVSNPRFAGAVAGAAVAVAVAVAATVGAGGAAADDSAGGFFSPLVGQFRNCSHDPTRFVSSRGSGGGNVVTHSDAGRVTADVHLQTAVPNTRYSVRLIQVPRAAERTCTAVDPGVAVAQLFTDGNGTGAVTVSGARESWATGAWVSVDGPPPPGRVIGEFYTSDLVAPLG